MEEALRLLTSGDPETWSIIGTSLRFSLSSTLLALVLALPAGLFLAMVRFRGRKTVLSLISALQAVPTVVVGLLVYGLISRSGPWGGLSLLYEPGGVILGQAILCFPIVASLVVSGLEQLDPRFRETLRTLGVRRLGRILATLAETKGILAAAVVTAFGRVTGEVGVSMMLGGNIRGSTRTMTTAIALDTAKGEFERALGLGLTLLLIALAVNFAVYHLVRHEN